MGYRPVCRAPACDKTSHRFNVQLHLDQNQIILGSHSNLFQNQFYCLQIHKNSPRFRFGTGSVQRTLSIGLNIEQKMLIWMWPASEIHIVSMWHFYFSAFSWWPSTHFWHWTQLPHFICTTALKAVLHLGQVGDWSIMDYDRWRRFQEGNPASRGHN